ncbi:MAG: hypothetical protein Q8941_19125 [Bacteroidota bacterium]|nr:hypothetical protein [Bacteroidota bacterium]
MRWRTSSVRRRRSYGAGARRSPEMDTETVKKQGSPTLKLRQAKGNLSNQFIEELERIVMFIKQYR